MYSSSEECHLYTFDNPTPEQLATLRSCNEQYLGFDTDVEDQLNELSALLDAKDPLQLADGRFAGPFDEVVLTGFVM